MRPLIFLGERPSERFRKEVLAMGWGHMYAATDPNPEPGQPWAFDNGAFMAWKDGRPFPEQTFMERLNRARHQPTKPYLAVTPDIVANGCESLDFSMDWLTRLPMDWPWYLAVQDGMELSDVEPELGPFSGIFLGGTDKFKLTAQRWADLAHKHQIKFHYGRAGTPRKLRHAFKVGADSCDSALPLWSQERLREFIATFEGLGMQRRLECA